MVDPNTVFSLLDLQEQNEELQGEINELKKLVSILQSNLNIIREYTRYENYG
jgi:cell division protein FtsB